MKDENMDFIIPYGKHEGERLGDVPINYLKHMLEEEKATGAFLEILQEYEEEITETPDCYGDTTLEEIV